MQRLTKIDCQQVINTMHMKKIFLLCFAMNLLFAGCKKNGQNTTPECIQKRIELIKSQPARNPPAEIHEYLYNGKTVYLLSADCCDQYDELLDANCNKLCSPSGGIDGKGDGKCADFVQKARHIRLLWKDDRVK